MRPVSFQFFGFLKNLSFLLHLKVVSLASDSNMEDQVRVFVSPSDILAQLNLEAYRDSFSSPSTTRIAAVEVFQTASTREKVTSALKKKFPPKR
jgi:hypothetical protein